MAYALPHSLAGNFELSTSPRSRAPPRRTTPRSSSSTRSSRPSSAARSASTRRRAPASSTRSSSARRTASRCRPSSTRSTICARSRPPSCTSGASPPFLTLASPSHLKRPFLTLPLSCDMQVRRLQQPRVSQTRHGPAPRRPARDARGQDGRPAREARKVAPARLLVPRYELGWHPVRPSRPCLLFWSTSDSLCAPSCRNALDAFDRRWPPFTSHISVGACIFSPFLSISCGLMSRQLVGLTFPCARSQSSSARLPLLRPCPAFSPALSPQRLRLSTTFACGTTPSRCTCPPARPRASTSPARPRCARSRASPTRCARSRCRTASGWTAAGARPSRVSCKGGSAERATRGP